MYRNFTVKNFRCFPSLLLNPLGQVNLIAGKNNTGKTALLEAIHLHSYPQNCDLPFAINEFRGTDTEKRYDEETCDCLFCDKRPDYGFETISQDENGKVRY